MPPRLAVLSINLGNMQLGEEPENTLSAALEQQILRTPVAYDVE